MKKFLAVLSLVAWSANAQTIVPVPFYLFGPAQTTSSQINGISGAPQWVGIVLTGSTYHFNFDNNVLPAQKASMRVLWSSRNTANYVQLVAFDDGPVNVVEIARVQGNGSMTPANQIVDFTAVFNDLRAAGVRKNLGFRVGGDGINQWTLNAVRLEINYQLP